jgi:hypothetical protein
VTVLYVKRESENQKTQLVALTQQTSDDQQVVTGSDRPLINVAVNHQRLHEGRAFFAYYVQNSGTPLASGASINIVFAAGPGTTPHMTIGLFCGGDAEFFLFEGATSTGGTSFTQAPSCLKSSCLAAPRRKPAAAAVTRWSMCLHR